jgi:hydroxyethylthiazole kinase
MRSPLSHLPEIAADVLERLRERRPRVHCLTNAVAQAYTANMLLAAGAIPSMTIARDEIGAFVARADALLINLGTFDAERRAAALKAIAAAQKAGRPWVLDPVFIDRSKPRAAFAKRLAAKAPGAVRLNAAEFEALAGAKPDHGALARHAKKWKSVVGLTGAQDLIHDGARLAGIANGDPLMARVTAMGCAGSALVAAALAVEPDAWSATAAALIVFGFAGEIAAARARGPGSFAIEIIDALAGLDRDTVLARAKVT